MEDNLHAEEIMGAHVDINDLQKNYIRKNDTEFFNNAFKFAFVRNPFDWLLSTYFYIKCAKGHKFHDRISKMNLYQFLNWYIFVARYMDRPFGSNKYLHLKNFLTDEYGNVIIDYIGQIEKFQEGIDHVLSTLDMKHQNVEVVNKNPNRKAEWKEYYDPRCRKIVETYFGEDLEFFGYNFEGMTK